MRLARAGRWALWLLLIVGLILPGLLLAGAFGLLGTEPGSRWLLEQARQQANTRVEGLQLAWDTLEGTLLGELRVRGLQVKQPDLEVGAESLTLRWRPRGLLDRHLHLEALDATGLDYRGRSPKVSEPVPTEPLKIELPEIELPIRITLDRLAIDRARIEHDDFVYQAQALRLSLKVDGDQLQITGLELASEPLALKGDLALGAKAPHSLTLDLSGSGAAPEIGRVSAELSGSGPALQPTIDLRISAPKALNVAGQIDLRAPDPVFDLKAQWPELAWPLQGEADYRSLDGRLTLAGRVEDYRLTLVSRLSGKELPDLGLDLTGHGSSAGLDLQPLSLQLLDGALAVRGRIDWAPEIAWKLTLEARDLDPGRYPFPSSTEAPDLSGRLSARLDTEGRLKDGQPSLSIDIAELDGRLRDQPLRARGRLEIDQGADGLRLLARELDLASGQNRVQLDGRFGPKIDMAFEINAPDLSELSLLAAAELAGVVNGKGRLGGTQQQPTLQAKLSGQGLVYQAYRLEQLGLNADWSENGGQVLLSAVDVDLDGSPVEQARLELNGRPEAHRLELSATAAGLELDLGAEGGLDLGAAGKPQSGPSWRGQLQQLSIGGTPLGAWALATPVGLSVGAERGELGRLCLQPQTQTETASGQLCAQGNWQASGAIELDGRIERLALGLLAPLLPEELKIDGSLDGRVQVSGRADAPLAELELIPSDGLLTLAGADEPLEIAYRNAEVKARYSNAGGDARLRLELGDNGRAEGTITLGPTPRQALGGTVRASFPDLTLIAGLVPALESTEGKLDLSAEFAGTLAQPRLTGELKVAGARARVPDAGIEIQDISLAARSDGLGPLRIEGGARSGDGQLALSGTADLDRPGLPLDVTIQGTDFQVVRLPEALVTISPELRISGAEPYQISGKLLIPKAQIEIKEIPASAVGVSSDEVIVGREAKAKKTGTQGVEADVQVELGDQVSLKGFGLKTKLTGGVRAVSNAKGAELNGKINLVDATYKAYGQDLKVEQGRLLFAGPPDNPELDLRALRVSNDGEVTAYLAMSGPASKPRPRIYSEPALPDAEALAYLLTGRGLDQAGEGEGSDIANAAISYGIAQGEPLLQGMADRLGLDDLKVQGGENGLTDSSLLIGKYLRPDLYVGYTQGLFDVTAAVLLRLNLTENIEVESRAGTSQSIDLYYRLEHD